MITDHQDHKFCTVREMYKAWGLTDWVYYQRKSKGWSLKSILETPVRRMINNNSDDTTSYWCKTHHHYHTKRKSKTMKLLKKEITKCNGGYVECREYGHK